MVCGWFTMQHSLYVGMVLESGIYQVVGLRSTKGAPSVRQYVLVFGIDAKSDCFKCSNN